MKLSVAALILFLSRDSSVEGSFLRDVVGSRRGVKPSSGWIEERLLSKAIPLNEYRANLRARGLDIPPEARRLDMEEYWAGDDESYQYFDFDGYSLKYATCQPVQKFSVNAIYAGEYNPMITDDIVILRLCPSSSCSASREYGCKSDFADYAVNINDYVGVMINYKIFLKESLCKWCEACSMDRKLEEGDENEENDQGNQNENDQDQQDEDNNENGDNEDNEQEQGNQDQNQDMNNDQDGQGQGDDAVNQEDQGDDQGNNDDAYENANQANGYNNNNYWGADGDDDGYDDCSNSANYCYDNGVSICEENEDDDSNYLDLEDYLEYLGCQNVKGYYLRPRCNGYDQSISMGIYYDHFCSQYAGDKVNMNSLGLGIHPYAFEEFYNSSSCLDCSGNQNAPLFNSNQKLCGAIQQTSASCTSNLKNTSYNDNSTTEATACTYIESLRRGSYDEEGRLFSALVTDREVTEFQKWGLVVSLGLCALLAVYSCYLHHSITNLLIKSISHTELLPRKNRHTRSSRKVVSSSAPDDEEEGEETWEEEEVPKKTLRRNSRR